MRIRVVPPGGSSLSILRRSPSSRQKRCRWDAPPECESSWTDEKGMLESQRRKAVEVGANGLILGAFERIGLKHGVINKTGTPGPNGHHGE